MNTIYILPVVKPVAGESINCLRCRHCKLLPQGTVALKLGHENIPVHCRKTKRNHPLQLASCPVADARPYMAKDVRKGNPEATGDFVKCVTGVERVFLRHHYPRASMEYLVGVTGRAETTLRAICNRFGIRRASDVIKHGREWPQAQRAYVESCINSTFWPRRGFGAKTVRAQEIRGEITQRVAELGPTRTWLEIRKYAKGLTPAYYARKPKKVARHRELQSQKRALRIAGMTAEERARFDVRSLRQQQRKLI